MSVELDLDQRKLAIRDDLTIFEAADVHEALLALSREGSPIDVDLSGLRRIDCAGAQVLLAAARSCALTISGVSPSLQERLQFLGIEALS